MCVYIYIYIYVCIHIPWLACRATACAKGGVFTFGTGQTGTWPNGYPCLFLASSFRTCLTCKVLKGISLED